MTEIEQTMRAWLASGTPAEKLHARLRIAIGFAGAVVSHIVAGLPTLDQAAIGARLAVCAGCDQRLSGGICAGCGCNLETKASWADQDCPLGKWPRLPAEPLPAP